MTEHMMKCILGALIAMQLTTGALASSVFVNYAFYQNGLMAERNLRYFLNHGVQTSPLFDIAFGIVIKGECRCAPCEQPQTFLQDPQHEKLITVITESNEGFDFGAHATMLEHLTINKKSYDYYIFLNCGVIGPILPTYFPHSWHWASAFLDRMKENIGLVGTSIACLPRKDRGGYGPKVEGFAFAMSAKAVDVVRLHGTSFRQHKTKVNAILQGEAALTTTVMEHGIGIDCLLLAYQGIDWFNKKEWNCNRNKYPSRENTNHGISISPLEVIFHKEFWRKRGSVMENYTDRYVMWNDMQLCRERKRLGKANLGYGECL